MAAEAKYSIVREVGRGGYGVVHEAVANRSKRKVAVKRTPCDVPENAELALRESRALRSIQRRHENAIQLEGCILQHGRLFQPPGERRPSGGQPAAGGAVPEGPEPPGSALRPLPVVRDGILRGRHHEGVPAGARPRPAPRPQLRAAARRRRGLPAPQPRRAPRPQGRQRPRRPGPRRPRGRDFGLSKVCRGRGSVHGRRFSSACGSSFFLAPEVWEGHSTAKADIFALGITFWAMVERITFRDGDAEKELLGTYICQGEELIPLGEALLENPNLKLQIPLKNKKSMPEDLCKLLHHMLAFNPKERLDAFQLEAQIRRISYGRKRQRSAS